MKRSRGATFQATVAKPNAARRPPEEEENEISDLSAWQGFVAKFSKQ